MTLSLRAAAETNPALVRRDAISIFAFVCERKQLGKAELRDAFLSFGSKLKMRVFAASCQPLALRREII